MYCKNYKCIKSFLENDMKDFISIIILNYNGKKWLRRCLDSLMAQTNRDFEIIFVDNASSDGSIEYVEKKYTGVKIIRSEKNIGFAGGNNLGISHARGKYIMLLNNDTWVEIDFLEKMKKSFLNSDYDVIGPREDLYFPESLKKKYLLKIDVGGHPVCLLEEKEGLLMDDFYLSGVCLFFEKKFYEDTLGLDSNFFMYFEEIDWFWRLHLLKKRMYKDDTLVVHHAGSGSTGRGIKENAFLWRNQNQLQMLLKNYKWFTLAWIVPIYVGQNIVEMVFFLLMGKPKISLTYIRGWWFNVTYLRMTLRKRKWVQERRKVGDWEIMKKMYWGLGKLKHLVEFYAKK